MGDSMSNDAPRRRPRFEPTPRPPGGDKKARAPSDDRRDRPPPGHVGDTIDFDPPTNPRGRKYVEPAGASEAPTESEPPPRRAGPDSFQPVRVAPRSVRPVLSFWTRAWGTAALIVAVGGAAAGVVRSLRNKSTGVSARPDTSANITTAAPAAAAAEPKPPAAVPGPAALAIATSAIAPAVPSATVLLLPGATMPQRAGVPRGAGSPGAAPPQRSSKPDVATNWRPVTPFHEEIDGPIRAPAPSASPAASGTSEAWVTEERRF